MNERILISLIVLVAVLGVVPGVDSAIAPFSGLALVILGLVAGAMGGSEADASQRTAIYVLAVALPGIADSLDVIPTVGPMVNGALDSVAIALAGMAVAMVVMQLKARMMPSA